MERKDGASCLVIFLIEHELKAVRKRVTSFVSDDRAESFLFSLCFWRSLYLDLWLLMKLLRRSTMRSWMIVCMTYGRIFPSGIFLKVRIGKKLLELACGTGIQSVRFSQAGFDVTGLDLSADMLKIAEKKSCFSQAEDWFYRGQYVGISRKQALMISWPATRILSATCKTRWK